MNETGEEERRIEIKPELDERPPMTEVVAEVHLKAPFFPSSQRKTTKLFIQSLLAAYRIRATDEVGIIIIEDGDQTVVMRRRENVEDEIRFRRLSPTRAIMYCDERELENLHVLGVLDRAKVKKVK
ncbi:MAG: hypothetical protein GY771_07880 [bacterium]|nr:hypothetical protein [bacterium]